jgi:hypothetical protein
LACVGAKNLVERIEPGAVRIAAAVGGAVGDVLSDVGIAEQIEGSNGDRGERSEAVVGAL